MKTTPWDKNMPEIITKGVDAIQGRYLKKIEESAIRGISLSKANHLFILIIKDFKTGILSSDDLANFGFKIFHGVAKHYPDSDLFRASLSASDLNFEIRSKGNRIPQCLEIINKFYEDNK